MQAAIPDLTKKQPFSKNVGRKSLEQRIHTNILRMQQFQKSPQSENELLRPAVAPGSLRCCLFLPIQSRSLAPNRELLELGADFSLLVRADLRLLVKGRSVGTGQLHRRRVLMRAILRWGRCWSTMMTPACLDGHVCLVVDNHDVCRSLLVVDNYVVVLRNGSALISFPGRKNSTTNPRSTEDFAQKESILPCRRNNVCSRPQAPEQCLQPAGNCTQGLPQALGKTLCAVPQKIFGTTRFS